MLENQHYSWKLFHHFVPQQKNILLFRGQFALFQMGKITQRQTQMYTHYPPLLIGSLFTNQVNCFKIVHSSFFPRSLGFDYRP